MNDKQASDKGSPFWRFSLRFYRMPGVADACIALQEQAGVDVNLLLFLLWHATARRALSQAEVTTLEARVGGWRDTTVIPLRTVRRTLKELPPNLVPGTTGEAFRTRIKAVELEAERLQQEAMYSLASPNLLGTEQSSAAEAARANVTAYEAMRARVFPKGAVETLLNAFADLSRQSSEG
jgi:uncharacterized protein (TIGR02444 family)